MAERRWLTRSGTQVIILAVVATSQLIACEFLSTSETSTPISATATTEQPIASPVVVAVINASPVASKRPPTTAKMQPATGATPRTVVTPSATAPSVAATANPEVTPIAPSAIVKPTPAQPAEQTNGGISPVIPPAQPGDSFVRGPFTIGLSVLGQPLHVYQFGNGPIRRALIGGIHGGYEWNTIELMTETIEYLTDRPDTLPPELTLYILPNANPDGYAAGTSREVGRPNANRVDLNRNWDYEWSPTAYHGKRVISGGIEAFSEPETRAMRDFIVKNGIEAVIFYHSAFAAVFQGAGTENTKTVDLAKSMARATGYRHLSGGVPGQVTTGDSIDWLTAKQGITAVEVELRTHEGIDWTENLRGFRAFFVWDLPGMNQETATPPVSPVEQMTPEPVTQPIVATVPPSSAVPTAGGALCASGTYVVQQDDTLLGILLKCGYGNPYEYLRAFMSINKLESEIISPGKELILPKR